MKLLIAIIAFAALTGCSTIRELANPTGVTKVTVTTKDGTVIDYYNTKDLNARYRQGETILELESSASATLRERARADEKQADALNKLIDKIPAK